MYFSDLHPTSDFPENKQRLNLSSHAYNVLIYDMSVFIPDDAPMSDTVTAFAFVKACTLPMLCGNC